MHPDAEIGGEGEDVQQEVELARLRAEVERLRGAVWHAVYRQHNSDGCDACRQITKILEEDR